MELLKALYIFSAVFGVGILIVDFMGALNHDSDDSYGGGGDTSEAVETQTDGEEGSDIASKTSKKGTLILKLLALMQSTIYFSIGFGVTGLFAVYTGESPFSSLLWSLSAGFILTIVALMIKKMQKKVLDSQVSKSELLLEQGEVIVPIEKGKIGKVRISLENQIVDRFARSKDKNLSFSMGEAVLIEEVTEEYIFIEKQTV
jgi:membrane protein implicated in regulation of membrane protease activity